MRWQKDLSVTSASVASRAGLEDSAAILCIEVEVEDRGLAITGTERLGAAPCWFFAAREMTADWVMRSTAEPIGDVNIVERFSLRSSSPIDK